MLVNLTYPVADSRPNCQLLFFKFCNDTLTNFDEWCTESYFWFPHILYKNFHELLYKRGNMVRTRADRVPRKAVGEKSSAKKCTPVKINTKKNANGKGGKKHSGGNPYHPRETPKWQKSITCFMNTLETTSEATSSETSSSKEDENLDVKTSIEDKDDESD